MSIELRTVSIEKITFGDRFRDDYGDLATLITSIKKEGIIQPLAVRACAGNEEYILLAGGRRYKACLQAGISEIPVRVFPDTLNELEMRSIELMENVARKDLSWIEATNLNKEIHLLQQQIYGKKTSTSPDAPGVSLRDTAKLLGQSPGGLSDDIKLANAIEAFPTLKEAKTKSDAMKMLKKLEEDILVREIAKRHESKLANTPIDVIRKDLVSRYILKDFFVGVRQIPDNSIDIVEVDPPYGIDLKKIKKEDGSVGTRNYNEIDHNDYPMFLTNLFKECYRVMSPNSWIICWYGQEPWAELVFKTMINAGFTGNRIHGTWYKDGSPGQTNNPGVLLANSYETFYYMRKGQPNINRQGRSNVFQYAPVAVSKKCHPTERPIELIQDILQTFSWDNAKVLVPFLGSGNTLLATSNLGMQGVGYDLSEDYRNSYIVNVNESTPGSYKSYRS